MVNTKLKALKAGLYAIMFLCLVSFVLAIDSYRPYLHNPEVPENPGLKLQGSYQTALWPGAATYSYGIDIPPGRNGLRPSLGISYNSHSTSQRPGIVGTAWTLSQNYIWREVDYSFADASDDKFNLVLNGQSYELVYVPSEGRYHTKIESFLHITKVSGGSNDKGEYWVVKSKDGTTYRFGYNKDSELVSNLHDYAVRWSLDLVTDTHGNEIYYSYSENPTPNDIGAVYPLKIEYNNEKARVIEFVLEDSDRPDKWMVYEQGNRVREARRIKEIVVKADGELVRKYAFSYTTLGTTAKSFLSSITLFGSDGTSSLPPTTFEYNGVSKGWAEDSSWQVPADAAFGGNKDYGVRLVDFNRDGLVDLTVDGHGTWLNTGSGWAENGGWSIPYPTGIVDSDKLDTGVRFVELNGDGLTDAVRADGPATADRDSWLNTGSGWTDDQSDWHLPTGAHPINIDDDNYDRGRRFVDLNGDGMVDILGNAGSYQSAWINNGNGWTKDDNWAPPPDAEFVDSLDNPEDQGTRIDDVNGDGLPDLIRAEFYHKTWLNTGNGWALDDNYAISQIDFVRTIDGEDEGVRLADVNGDGLVDILKGEGSLKEAWINTGAGWSKDPAWKIPELASFVTEEDGDNKGVRVADVNGDGLPDLVKAKSSSDSSRKTWINKASKAYLLKSVNNGIGGKTVVDYEKSTSVDNTGSDDLPDLGFNMWIVERAVGDNGIVGAHNVLSKTDYSYLDGLYDYGDREFRGFNSVQEIQPATSITRHWFHQDNALKGMEYRTEVLDGSSVPFKRADSGFTSKAKDGYNVVELSSEEQSLFDGSNIAPKVTRTEYGYDGYGNVISTDYLGEKDAAGDEKKESWEFVYNTDKWIVDRPSHYVLSGPDAKVARQTFYRYDGLPYGSSPVKGDLTWEEQWLESGNNPVITYKYDDYGNLIEAKNARGFTTSYEFGISDPTFTFGEKTVNPAGHAFLYSYDLGTGNLLSETDANGNIRSHSYDVFSRVKKDILPYDAEDYPTKEYAYVFDGTSPEAIKVSQREKSDESGTLDAYYFYDGFGKLAQLRSEAENSEQAVTNFYYDALGRLARRSNPYFDPAAAEYALPKTGEANSSYSYDALSRVVKVENPDKSSKSIGFDHWKVTYLDENGNKRTFNLDAYDNIARVTEYVGDNYYATEYAYDLAGNIVRVKDAYGNQISYAYDTLSRKVMQTDPDLGTWKYSYDENGNLLATTDNSGKTVNLKYDVLDRVVEKKSGDDVVKFFYDDVKGTLAKTESGDVSVSYDYDQRLRKIKETTTIDSMSFASGLEYDSADRVTKTRLPDDSEISYNYNSNGLLEGISGVVTDVDYNAVSSPLMLSYGNGLVTSYSYNPDNFRIHKVTTGSKQELAYSYDALGNVVRIGEDAKGVTEAMGYDELNRLTSWDRETGEAKNQLDFEYDALGDIARVSSESGGSSYNYGNSPRHSAAKIVAQAGEPEDPEKPSKITIISPVDNAVYDKNNIDLNWTTTESLVWCAYSMDNGALNKSICPMGDDAPFTNPPSNAENEALIGIAEWYNPSNATAKDGAYAYATLSKDNSVKEASVRLVKNGKISGKDKSTNAELPSELTYVSYGSPSDLWGLDIVPSDINSKGFGVAYSAHGSVYTSQYLKATDFGFDIPIDAMINGVAVKIFQYQSGPPFAKMAVVDYMVITVYYTAPRTRNITFQASEGAHSIVIHGTDSSGGQVKSQTVHFNVGTSQVALNIISPIENLTFYEGDLIKLNVVADYNGDGELSYSISSPKFSKDNNVFKWQTGQGDAGVYPVAITVSDGKVSDTSDINISVKDTVTGAGTDIFDNFDDGVINDSIWVQNGWNGGTLAETGGALHFETGSSDDRQIRTRTNLAEYGSFNLTFKIKINHINNDKNVGFWLGNLAEGEPGAGSGHRGYYWQFHGATKGFNIGAMHDDGGKGIHGKYDPPNWEPGKWHSIRIEKTGASMKFFFDGELVGEDSEFVSSISELYWATGRTWKDPREGESASIYLDNFSVKHLEDFSVKPSSGIFDNFDDGIINDSIWVQNGWNSGTLTESEGTLYFSTGSSGDRQIRTKTNLGAYGEFNIKFKIKIGYVSPDKNSGFWLGNLAEGEPGAGSGHRGYYWQFHGATKGFNIGAMHDDGGKGIHGKYDPPNWEPGKWHDIIIERANGTVNFYFDGNLVGSDTKYAPLLSELYWNTGRTWRDPRSGESAQLYIDDFEVTAPAIQENQPPIIDAIVPNPDNGMSVNEGKTIELEVIANDPEGDKLHYMWRLDGKPVSYDKAYTYTPGYDESGEHRVKVSVGDIGIIVSDAKLYLPLDYETTKEFNITVNDINRVPSIMKVVIE
ncbi:VCBS repeat-containing protein [Candidatus Woesearchaeota archaeon]|nr:VCBS repeat-containing protein [Candidatus Woesearchaeota archaeon]